MFLVALDGDEVAVREDDDVVGKGRTAAEAAGTAMMKGAISTAAEIPNTVARLTVEILFSGPAADGLVFTVIRSFMRMRDSFTHNCTLVPGPWKNHDDQAAIPNTAGT